MARGHVSLHRGLREGQLSTRYRRLRGGPGPDDAELADPEEPWDDHGEDAVEYDTHWNPWRQMTPLDFEIEKRWRGLALLPESGSAALAGVGERSNDRLDPPNENASSPLIDALFEHVQRLVDPAAQLGIARRLDRPRAELRDVAARAPALAAWIAAHRGPAEMLLLLWPFWVRPIGAWVAPADAASVGRSLLEHLFARFPIPRALLVPWTRPDSPGVKWATWTVLVGGGASLRHAARPFGWHVSTGLVHHLFDAPDDLEPIEAIMWAELAQRGGTAVELARLRRHPAYFFDTTSGAHGGAAEDRGAVPDERAAQYRAFWIATVDWLVRCRDALTDEACAPILDWAMHRFTEDLARGTPPHACFSWSGRTPRAAHEAAMAYVTQLRQTSFAVHAVWRARGWDWAPTAEQPRAIGLPEGAWQIRELVTSHELAAESAAMHHCVGSYTHRCVAGTAAIFSARRDGERVFTIELEPASMRVVQARGPANRSCTDAELALVARWLDAVRARAGRGER